MKLFLNQKLAEISLALDQGSKPERLLIMAHGAGAGMEHPFTATLAKEIAQAGTLSLRFNFPYMEKGRKAPGSPKEAVFSWNRVLDEVHRLYPELDVFISGKSYGGRMASHVMAEGRLGVKGIIYFGFPLHPPGKEAKDRGDHLVSIDAPQLFIQGYKDKLANIDLISEVVTGISNADLQVIADADHSFNVPKRTGITKEQMMVNLARIANEWMDHIARRS